MNRECSCPSENREGSKVKKGGKRGAEEEGRERMGKGEKRKQTGWGQMPSRRRKEWGKRSRTY